MPCPINLVAAEVGPIKCCLKWKNELKRCPGKPHSSTQGGNMNIRETAPRITELEKISTRTDTRDYLAKAAPTTEKLKDWLVVDVDARQRDGVLVGGHRPHRQRGPALHRGSVSRPRRRPACSTPTVRSTRTSPAASCTSRSWPSRRRPACIARCSSPSAPWTRWASTTWWCSRPRCCRSACIRRSTSRWRSAMPITAG